MVAISDRGPGEPASPRARPVPNAFGSMDLGPYSNPDPAAEPVPRLVVHDGSLGVSGRAESRTSSGPDGATEERRAVGLLGSARLNMYESGEINSYRGRAGAKELGARDGR